MNAANALGLPLYQVESNAHAFTHKIGEQKLGYCAIYSCILSLQKYISKYYTSSTYSYGEIKHYEKHSHNFDMAEFAESYLVPLIQTDSLELIIDGCQYRRCDKLKNIVDWDIAQKYLNVCVSHMPDASNCGFCGKCLRTLLPLEILGKLDKFSRVFDVEGYRKNSFRYKCRCVENYDADAFFKEAVDLARENNFPMPTKRSCYTLGQQAVIL